MRQTIHIACFLFLLSAATATAHNITHILAEHPDFSTFNHYLTTTHLADEINRRRTITVCAVDNAAMNELLSKHFPMDIIKNVLSLHIFADYFGAKKLHRVSKGSTTTSSLFQATGEAAGTSGFVNITDMKGGKVGFNPIDSGSEEPVASFVKSIQEIPYVISVIQISHILTSPEAEAPTGAPIDLNITTALVDRHGCEAFTRFLVSEGAMDTFDHSLDAGLTIFCPSDEALESFKPRYRNLTADGKMSVLLFHGIPRYNSLGMLRSSKGLINTLATEGSKKFDLSVQEDEDDVKILTKVVTATITGTLLDRDPLAAFGVDKVLLPKELFTSAPAAPAPKAAKAKSKSNDEAPEPSDDDDDDVADEDSTNGGSDSLIGGGAFATVSLSLIIGILAVML